MSNPILYQGLGGLLIVFFLVMIYFFAKTWNWLHIVSVVLVFGASFFLLRNAAAVYRTMNVWRTEVAKTEPQIQRLSEENRRLLYGPVDDVEQTYESTWLLGAKLRRITLDQGRVWRQCTPQPPQPDNTVVVSTVPPAAAVDPSLVPEGASPAAAPAPNLIQEQTVLHVFLESVPPPEAGAPEGKAFPYYFVGDFVAVAATNTSVTLKPLRTLSEFDSFLIRQNYTWALYDTMPVDGHEWFNVDPDQKPNWNQPANESPIFGTINEGSVKALFQWQRFVPQSFAKPDTEFKLALERVSAAMDQYLRDGKGVANRDEFPPMLVWTKIRFLKGGTQTVDSGAKVSPFTPGVTDDFFDRSGMAEVAILQLGKPAEYKEGDVAIFPQEDAQRLINDGSCKFEEYVYVRPLNDYSLLLRILDQRRDRVIGDIAKMERDIAQLQASQANANQQLAVAKEEQMKLQQDLKGTQTEATRIAEYSTVLETQWADTLSQLAHLHQTNLQLNSELERRQQELSDAANRRATPAVTGN